MRTAAIVLLFGAVLSAQQPTPEAVKIPTKAEWVGPLEFHDYRGLTIVPTLVTLTFTGSDVKGEWRSVNKLTNGAIFGTVDDKSRLRLKITLFAGSENPTADGKAIVVAPERCKGEADFEGVITRTGVLRWTTDRIRLSTPAKQLSNTDCADMAKVVWTLQLH